MIAQAKSLIKKHLKKIPEGKIPLIVICGPTASGKTGLSIPLAKKFNGEIVSSDSRQVYKGMDIGTDKITEDEMQGIKHHMIDVVEPSESFTLADFVEQAEKSILTIWKEGKIPFLVGGTGLYLDAIAQNYDLPKIPPNKKLREKYEQMAKEKGKEAVYEYLKSIDPVNAEKIHPNNLRYVIRAIEIFKINKQPKKNQTRKERKYHILKIGIERPREELYNRINARVGTQVDRGILDELKTLLEKCPRSASSMSSLGYKEYFPYLDGEENLENCVETLKKNTRNYAKRQLTWFRRDEDINWIKAN